MLALSNLVTLTIAPLLALLPTCSILLPIATLAKHLDVFHGTRFDCIDLVPDLGKFLFLQLGLLLSPCISEWVHACIHVLLLLGDEPLVLLFDFLFAPDAPSRDPVISDRVEYKSRPLLPGCHSTLLPELLPLGLWLLDWAWLLSRQDLDRIRHIEQKAALSVLKDLAVGAVGCILSLFKVEQLLVQGAQVSCGALRELSSCDALV